MNSKIVLVLLLMFVFNSLGAQEVDINLSIKWEKKETFLKLDEDVIEVPYLKIEYKNNSNENICLKKIIHDNYYLPNSCGALINVERPVDEKVLSELDFESTIFFYDLYHHIAYDDTINENSEIELPLINVRLFNLYKLLSTQKHLDENDLGVQLKIFKYKNKPYVSYRYAVRLLSSIYNEPTSEELNYVFIEPYGTISYKVSLLGMRLTNRNFTIGIAPFMLIDSSVNSIRHLDEYYVFPDADSIYVNFAHLKSYK